MEKKQRDGIIVTVVCALCITVLEIVALIQGINGRIFMVVIGALAGLGGYKIVDMIKIRRNGAN